MKLAGIVSEFYFMSIFFSTFLLYVLIYVFYTKIWNWKILGIISYMQWLWSDNFEPNKRDPYMRSHGDMPGHHPWEERFYEKFGQHARKLVFRILSDETKPKRRTWYSQIPPPPSYSHLECSFVDASLEIIHQAPTWRSYCDMIAQMKKEVLRWMRFESYTFNQKIIVEERRVRYPGTQEVVWYQIWSVLNPETGKRVLTSVRTLQTLPVLQRLMRHLDDMDVENESDLQKLIERIEDIYYSITNK
jgi:hypothetical protein